MVENITQSAQIATYSSQLYRSKKINKTIIYLLVLLVIIIGATYFISYLSNGYLLVKTSPQNLVSAALVGETSTQPPITLKPNVRARLHSGTYIVTVNNGLSSAKQVMVIHGHKTVTTNIALVSILDQLEPVTSISAMDLEASTTKLQFLDPNTSDLELINQSNNLSVLSSTVQFSSVQWVNQSYAVAQAIDGSLYIFNAGNLQQIKLPSYINTKALTYSVAPNQTLYFASGGKVYIDTNGIFNEIYNSRLNVPAYLAASSNKVAVGYPGQKNSLNIVVLSSSGRLIAGSTTNASGFRWSLDGNMLVVAGESYAEILGSNLNQIAIIPSYNVVDPVWLNNNTVVYASGGQVWSYDTQTMRANVIANTGNHNVNGIVADTDGAYLYLSIIGAKNNNSATTVMRVGLKGQVVSQTAVELAQYLPWVSGFCLVGYTNFSAPTLLVQSYVTPAPTTCSSAYAFLNQFGINTSTLGVNTSSILAKSY